MSDVTNVPEKLIEKSNQELYNDLPEVLQQLNDELTVLMLKNLFFNAPDHGATPKHVFTMFQLLMIAFLVNYASLVKQEPEAIPFDVLFGKLFDIMKTNIPQVIEDARVHNLMTAELDKANTNVVSFSRH